MKTLLALASAVMLGLISIAAHAHDYRLGDLEIIHPYTRPTPPGAPVAAGYMIIRNTGNAEDRLMGGKASYAEKVEVHQMTMDGDVMKMRPVEGGLPIPPGGEVVLERGGYHVMFMGLKEQMMEGQSYEATLTFEKAGDLQVQFSADKPKEGETMDHSKHGMANSGQSH
jgi:copper(I)-binding protein